MTEEQPKPRVIDAEDIKRARGIVDRPRAGVVIPTVWSTGPKAVGIDPSTVHMEPDGSIALGGGGESIADALRSVTRGLEESRAGVPGRVLEDYSRFLPDERRDWSGLPDVTVDPGYYRHADGELVHVAHPGYEKETGGAWAYRVAYRVVVKTRGGPRPVGPVFFRTVEDFRARFKLEGT